MTLREAVTTTPRVRRQVGSPRAFLGGLAILLLTWILIVPPYGGIDEFDHAYRAASAARGQWFPTPSEATRGTGAWLDVPADIVAAAGPECTARSYTTDADCVGTSHGDSVRIASGAGRYHPVFYALIGTAALPFHGDAALVAMRLATALLALALVALALAATGTWARSRTALVGPAVACTPVVVYSSSIASPNGVEMLAGLALWAAGVGLLLAQESSLRRLSVIAAVSGAVLCTLRPLGPLWCLLILLTLVVAIGAGPARRALLVRRRDVQVSAAVVALSACQGLIWTLTMGALRIGQSGHPLHTSPLYRLGQALAEVPVWVFQSIAAFPMRGDAAHPSVYVSYLLLFSVLVVWGWRAADARGRWGLAVVAGLSLLAPIASTISSYDAVGLAWQGRYGLPFSVGLVVLAGYALDRAEVALPPPWLVVAGVLFVVAQTVSTAYLLHVEVLSSPLAGSSAWLEPSTAVVVVLSSLGAALVWAGGPGWAQGGGARA